MIFDVYPDQYPALLEEKTIRLKSLFKDFVLPDVDVFDSPPKHFRMRAEFRIWHSDGAINYAMFSKEDKRTPVVITDFPRASEAISTLMPPLLAAIASRESLKKRLFQMDFLSSLSGEMLVTLIYHKTLDEPWREDALQLQSQFNIHLIGRARKQKEVLAEDFILEKLTVSGRQLTYQQVESSFTQPNAVVCEKMLTWAVDNSRHLSGDLLELYCGNGNFTLALAQNFTRVLATEVSKTSVKSARYNVALNSVDNVDVVRMSSEEITQAFNQTREFRRLAEIQLDKFQFNTLFVDPPRAGLDEQTLAFAKRFEHIIYISCNPNTLIDNLKSLSGYAVKKLALFDQFPYTDHIECGVMLSRR